MMDIREMMELEKNPAFEEAVLEPLAEIEMLTASIAKSTSDRQMPTTHTAMRVALSRPAGSRAR